jgi:HlyD family secretion protein
LQSSTQENVVNYTAVVDVSNSDGKLLPGMTATVDFIVETATDALYVSNASLRYRPDDETMRAAFERMRAEREARRDGSVETPPRGMTGANEDSADNRGMLWMINERGQLAMIPVRTGISDGTNTVVIGSRLEAGQQVIAGISSSTVVANNSSSPFQQQQSGNRRPGPPTPGGF